MSAYFEKIEMQSTRSLSYITQKKTKHVIVLMAVLSSFMPKCLGGFTCTVPEGTAFHTRSQRIKTSLSEYGPKGKITFENENGMTIDRREALLSAMVAGMAIAVPSQAAHASGGATAGGAYLLSAKQRYNQRVLAGVKSFLALSPSFESGDLKSTKAFFEAEEMGSWSDFSSAGYLLSNAFRRNSTTPPDSLPSVKKWKAFQAQVDATKKAVKKKDSKGALAAYKGSEEALDAYLEAVELPPVLELR